MLSNNYISNIDYVIYDSPILVKSLLCCIF